MTHRIKNTTLEELARDSSFFEGLKEKGFCLVLGAGFSYGIKNQCESKTAVNIPLSSDFIELTKDIYGISGNDFKEAANVWKNNFDDRTKEMFRKLFLVDEADFYRNNFASYRNILLPHWYRIYTFNFDNVLDTVIGLGKKKDKYDFLSYPDDHEFPSGADKTFIAHIHGKLTADSDVTPLVFFSTAYSNFYESTNNLYYSLLNAINDEKQGKDLIIVGCKFNEEIIYKNFLTKITRAGVRIFHFGPELPVFDEEIFEKADIQYHFIKCKTGEFLEFLGKNEKHIRKENFHDSDHKPYVFVRNFQDLDKVSKNFSIVENPIGGRFGGKDRILGWLEGKPFVSYEADGLLDIESAYKIFPITGSAGTGKSTLLFQNLDNYLGSNGPGRRILFIHPDALINLENILEKGKQYLIAVDSLDRQNKKENATAVFAPIFRIAMKGEIDAKFLLTVYSSSWESILLEYSQDKRVNFSFLFKELKAEKGWRIEDVYDKLMNYYQLNTIHPALAWSEIKQVVLEKAGRNPSFIRYIFDDALKQTALREDFFKRQPKGINQLIWKDISDIPESSTRGVITIILLLAYHPLLRLSRDSLRYILLHGDGKETDTTLEFLWSSVLQDTYIGGNLKGLDPVFQQCVKATVENEIVISDGYINSFCKQYRDFFISDFRETREKLIRDTRELIIVKNFRELKHMLKATELLLMDDSDTMLNFVSEKYSIGLEPKDGILRNRNELRTTLNRLWDQRIWKLQRKEVSEMDPAANSEKQYFNYQLLHKLVYLLYWHDPFKLHEFATQLRKFCLPAFDEDAAAYAEIRESILNWYHRVIEIQELRDPMPYQALAKFYLETNDFEKANDFIDQGLKQTIKTNAAKIISLYITQVDILLTESEILLVLGDERAETMLRQAKEVMNSCENYLLEKYDLQNISQYNQDVQTNIRVFYTFYPQFLDRCSRLRIESFPKYEDLVHANVKLEFISKHLPRHKDAFAANIVFKLHNLKKLYPEYQRQEIFELISKQLIARPRKEPKIIDVIREVISTAERENINLSRINELRALVGESSSSPHINRNYRQFNEKIKNEVSAGTAISDKDMSRLHDLELQPLNFDTAQNMIKGLLLRFCVLERKGISTETVRRRIFEIFSRENIRYKMYTVKSLISISNMLVSSPQYTSGQLKTFCDSFKSLMPGKVFGAQLFKDKYANEFYVTENSQLPFEEKKTRLEEIITNFRKIDLATGNKDKYKLAKFEGILQRLKKKYRKQ